MKSMTGYGRSAAQRGGYEISVEIRAVNHRFLELQIKTPRGYGYLEEKIKEALGGKISRGKVEMSLTLRRTDALPPAVTMQHHTVIAYLQALKEENRRLAKELPDGASRKRYLPDNLGLSDLLRLPDAFEAKAPQEEPGAVWECVQPAVAEALKAFLQMRITEGAALQADIREHLTLLKNAAEKVAEKAPMFAQTYYEKLHAKLEELLSEKAIDETRLVTEAGILAEKTAIDEELVRLQSHIAQMEEFLAEEGQSGRKMDFLVQEMNREVNTIGSKAQQLEITKLVVQMKSEIEKIREQIQNVE